MKCKKLENKRNYNIIDRNIENPEERMRVFLFRNKKHQMVSKMLRDLWELRKKKIKTNRSNEPSCSKKSQPRR